MKSLIKAVPPADEILVVADGGMDQTLLFLKDFGVKIVETPVRGGPALARNIGAKAATSNILFFVDADVTIYPDTFFKVAEAFRKDPDLTAIFGSYDDEPSAPNFLSQYRNLLHHYVHQSSSENASTFFGACGAIKRNAFLAIGGFNDKHFRRPSIEDIELGYRLKKTGHMIQLCKTLQIKHLKHWGVFSMIRTDFFRRAVPWTELILEHKEFLDDLNIDMSSRVSVILTFGMITALLGSLWWYGFVILSIIFGSGVFLLNVHIYRFFRRKRGLLFALKAVPWHWLYFFLSGLAFGFVVTRHFLLKLISIRKR